MALFNLRKKKEKKASSCCCSTTPEHEENVGCCCGSAQKVESESGCCGSSAERICCIRVLGSGCKSCHEQYENAKAAVEAMGLSVEVEYITDMEKIMAYGVMSMPAVVVNEKVVSMGKVLKSAEVAALLKKFVVS